MAAACFSLFLSLVLITPSNAQGGENRIIAVSGTATAYNNDTGGLSPLKFYKTSPPLMAATRVGAGAVVAAGMAATCPNNDWNRLINPAPYLNVLLDKAFQWMKSGATKVLWYEGHSVYETASMCSQLIAALENLGYSVTARGQTAPDNYITSSLLASYDILVIPQLQLGGAGTGGDPTLLQDAEVQAIKSFVEGGNGLLIMEGADFNGHNYNKVQNKILRALDTGFYFQDDQVVDDTSKWGQTNYWPIAVIDNTTWIGSAYENATGTANIGLYSICSLIMEENYDVSVRVSSTDEAKQGNAGQVLTYEVTIVNIGINSDNYTLTVGDELGWNPSISPNRIGLENGESATENVFVTVPTGLTEKVINQITLTAVGDSGATDYISFRAGNRFPTELPTFNGVTYPIFNPEVPRYLGPGLPDLFISPPAVPIITAIKTGYSNDLTPREPWPTLLYGQGEFPPMGAAALVGSGRVVAIANAILRNTYFDNPVLANDEVMSLIARWLINWNNPKGDNLTHPSPYKLLYYVAGSGVYHIPSQVSKWLDMLANDYGFEVESNTGSTITPALLENVNILQLAELMRPLSSEEIQVVVNWVNAGGGLIIMCQADYSGYGVVTYPNAVLDALGSGIKFQDDEVYDDNNYVVGGQWFPQVYLVDSRVGNPQVDVWFPWYNFDIEFGWSVISVENARVLFPLTITNSGTRDSSYTIDVQETSIPENLGWSIEISQTEVDVAAGENLLIPIFVTVPDIGAQAKTMDVSVTVQDKNQSFLTQTKTFTINGQDGYTPSENVKFEVGAKVYNDSWGSGTVTDFAYGGRTRGWVYIVETEDGKLISATEGELSTSQPGSPLLIIAAAIVVIVVIVAGIYFVRIRKR